MRIRDFYSDELLQKKTVKRIMNNSFYGLSADRYWTDEAMWDVMGETNELTNMLKDYANDMAKKEREKENMSIIKNSYICLNGEDKYRIDDITIDHSKWGEPEATAKFHIGPKTLIIDPEKPKVRVTKSVSLMDISKVIFNYPATIVFWVDGTKTIVKCKPGDQWDPHAGISAAIAKKFFGTQVNKWVKKAEYAKVPPSEDEVIQMDEKSIGETIAETIKDVFLGGH